MLIYLDIDGVLVSGASWRKPEILDDDFPNFTYKSIESLNKILSITKGNIILTTSHKHKYNNTEWKSIFKKRGIILNKDINKLPENIDNLSRKDELLKCFKENNDNINNIIIIDDDKSLNGLPMQLKNRLIQTNSIIGLNSYCVEKVIELIKQKTPPFK